jgi:hypothetical protein
MDGKHATTRILRVRSTRLWERGFRFAVVCEMTSDGEASHAWFLIGPCAVGWDVADGLG